ncbi:NYN domain-containing protein [Ramlibacter sp. AN1133]|uniref:NYN domain-containing protein n=1 Tax=Ramlibacter sp. AN1133 TaxID=3133429 RepID=UPI0030C2F6AD
MSAREARAGDAAAILIDADNLSPAAVEQCFTHMAHQGWRVTLRRAYGGHEKLAGMKDCLLRNGVRSLVNNGKGTTDALLVVDAMDLLHEGRLPPVVAIASSDADFAPLAVRLREGGTWVICFAQSGKSADADLTRCYDQLIAVESAGASAEDPAPAPRSAPAPARAARKAPARKKAAPPPPEDPVRDVLETIAGFRQGREIAMNEVVKRLRAAGLMGKSATGPAFLRKNAPYVELSPNYLRLKD